MFQRLRFPGPLGRSTQRMRQGERTVKSTIVAITAAAFLASAALPAVAQGLAPPPPLPAIGLWPAMIILGSKENKDFKPVNPYAKKVSKRSKRR